MTTDKPSPVDLLAGVAIEPVGRSTHLTYEPIPDDLARELSEVFAEAEKVEAYMLMGAPPPGLQSAPLAQQVGRGAGRSTVRYIEPKVTKDGEGARILDIIGMIESTLDANAEMIGPRGIPCGLTLSEVFTLASAVHPDSLPDDVRSRFGRDWWAVREFAGVCGVRTEADYWLREFAACGQDGEVVAGLDLDGRPGLVTLIGAIVYTDPGSADARAIVKAAATAQAAGAP